MNIAEPAGFGPGDIVWRKQMTGAELNELSEADALEATSHMDEHPDDYGGECNCAVCRSYMCDDAEAE